jgi:hypothetical protein
MSPFSRRRLAGLTLLTWLPLGLVWSIVWPENPEESAAVFASAAAHPLAWELAASLFALAFLLALPGLIATLGLVDDRRGGSLVLVGAVLAITGFIGDVVAGSFSVLLPVLAAQSQRAQMVDVWDTFGARPAPFATVVLILLGHLGLVLLGFGLLRAHLVGWWVPAAVTAGMLVETVLGTAAHASVATVALTGAGLVGVARVLLTSAQRLSPATPAAAPAVGV